MMTKVRVDLLDLGSSVSGCAHDRRHLACLEARLEGGKGHLQQPADRRRVRDGLRCVIFLAAGGPGREGSEHRQGYAGLGLAAGQAFARITAKLPSLGNAQPTQDEREVNKSCP